MNPNALALLTLTAIVGAVSAAVAFAALRIMAAARDARQKRAGAGEAALLSAALADAVTKLKAQERATAARAEASERMAGEIITSLSAGLLVVSRDESVRILNPAGRRMLRVPDGASLESYRTLLKEPVLSELIDECFRTGGAILRRSVTLSDVPPASPGMPGVSHMGVTVSPMADERGDIHGAICLFTDLTAVKQLEEQLRLKESLATVGELTAGIAHEFRNGLATIHGYSKLFDLSTLPDHYRQYVTGIRTEAEALSEVVTNFLNFARPAELMLSRVDIRAICERAAEEVRAEARALGGDVTLRGTFGAVEGDEVLLRQAFSNLLRNAVEACAGASVAPVVVIRAEIDAAQRMSRVVVEDNGPGIPPEARERVFQPFFTSKRSGTGLGLALVQKIIVFHNGRIAVSSSDLGGASLQVSLPIL
ncbi:MAG: nitrogen regulation protein NR(II) [Vicinamibacterales bacterium]